MSENEHKQLTPRQRAAIPLLLSEVTLEAGRKTAKIAKGTLFNWLKQPSFKEELKKQRVAIVEGALEVLKANTTLATKTLVILMASENDSIKHRAAKDIIQFTLKAMEYEELEERVERLEQKFRYK